MKLQIKPIQQNTEFGCLASCYAMTKEFLGIKDKEDESQLTKEAFQFKTKSNEHYYLKKLYDLGFEVKVFIETPYMLTNYNQLNSELGCKIPVEYQLIGLNDYTELIEQGYVIITLIDIWHLDMIVHDVHYVVINGFEQDSIYLTDPKYNREIKISKDKFKKSIDDLKYLLGYSPIIFAIKKKPLEAK